MTEYERKIISYRITVSLAKSIVDVHFVNDVRLKKDERVIVFADRFC